MSNAERVARWKERNREKHRQGVAEWRRKNPERSRQLRHQTKLRRFGLTESDYERMLAEQSGVCAICGQGEDVSSRRLAVDHDHATQQVRGLLCHRCNTGLGLFRDDPALLATAINYLKE